MLLHRSGMLGYELLLLFDELLHLNDFSFEDLRLLRYLGVVEIFIVLDVAAAMIIRTILRDSLVFVALVGPLLVLGSLAVELDQVLSAIVQQVLHQRSGHLRPVIILYLLLHQ